MADFLLPDFNLDALVPDTTFLIDKIERWANVEFEESLYDDIDYAFALYKQSPQILMQDPRFKESDVCSSPRGLGFILTYSALCP